MNYLCSKELCQLAKLLLTHISSVYVYKVLTNITILFGFVGMFE